MQAGPGRAGRLGDLAGRQVGVVVQGDGAPLSGGQAGHGRAQHVGPVQVVGRGQAVRGGRVQRLGPVGQQRDRGAAPQAAADVRHDAAQPAREPVWVAQPVKADERPQERLLNDVVHVARVAAQAPGAGRVPSAGAARRAGFRRATPPAPVSMTPNRMISASSGISAAISYSLQPWWPPATVRPWSSRGSQCLRISRRSPACSVRVLAGSPHSLVPSGPPSAIGLAEEGAGAALMSRHGGPR